MDVPGTYVPCLPGGPESVDSCLESCPAHISSDSHATVGSVPCLPGGPESVGSCLEPCPTHISSDIHATVGSVPCLPGGPESVEPCLGHIYYVCMIAMPQLGICNLS